MPPRPLAIDDLTALLARFPLERAGGLPLHDVNDAQIQALLARVAGLSGLLRDADATPAADAAARLLLSDLAMVAAQFRGRTNSLGEALSHARAGLRGALYESARREGR